jgi:hypothetical protein
MQIPLELHTRELDAQQIAEIRVLVAELSAKLEKVAPDLVSCRVHVEQDVHDCRNGNRFRVTIRATIPPKKEVIVHLEPGDGGPDETIEAVVRAAFAAARRGLRDMRKRLADPAAQPVLSLRQLPVVRTGLLSSADR